MLITASRRTDIPAFYPEWFMNRLRAGYCMVSNPFNPQKVQEVSLRPQDVDVITFVTKNPGPLMPYLDEIGSRCRFYFQFTLNPYGPPFEPGIPPLEERVRVFRLLASRLGRDRVIWRYDPIIVSDLTPIDYHLDRFRILAEQLQGFTERVHISFVDPYRKLAGMFASMGVRTDLSVGEIQAIAGAIAEEARSNGIRPFSCAEPYDLAPSGIMPGKCIDETYLRAVFGIHVNSRKDPSQRRECGCIVSKDIGAYGTCLHGCKYCYAGSLEAGVRNRRRHDPASPFLLEVSVCCTAKDSKTDV